MEFGSIIYFAVGGSNRGASLIAGILTTLFWFPSHYFFKWLRKKHNSDGTFALSIIGCLTITIGLIAICMWLGNTYPALIASNGVKVNTMWLPAGLLALGIWAGFLSGYVKMRIS